MSKKRLITVIIVLTLVLSVFVVVYDGFNKAPKRLKINYRYLESPKIAKDLDGLQIAFISDIYYNNFMDKERFENIVEKINENNPDVVIFLGDLFDSSHSSEVSDKTQVEITNLLTKISAKYGKFAVLGENDYYNNDMEMNVNKVLFDANFEVLKNDVVNISKDSKETFQLVGIDSPINKKDDIQTAYKDVKDNQFTLTVLHTPDTAKVLPQKKTDLVVAGHSLGGQINIPLLGQIYNKELAEKFYSGLYNIGSLNLYVSNGLGTTNKDVRIFAPAEVVIYTLKSK